MDAPGLKAHCAIVEGLRCSTAPWERVHIQCKMARRTGAACCRDLILCLADTVLVEVRAHGKQ